MTHIIDGFLTDNHTDGEGHIEISDDIKVLKLTAELIKTDKPTDFDCMKSEILELDAMEELAEALAEQQIDKCIQILVTLTDASETILTETIDRLLRAN